MPFEEHDGIFRNLRARSPARGGDNSKPMQMMELGWIGASSFG